VKSFSEKITHASDSSIPYNLHHHTPLLPKPQKRGALSVMESGLKKKPHRFHYAESHIRCSTILTSGAIPSGATNKVRQKNLFSSGETRLWYFIESFLWNLHPVMPSSIPLKNFTDAYGHRFHSTPGRGGFSPPKILSLLSSLFTPVIRLTPFTPDLYFERSGVKGGERKSCHSCSLSKKILDRNTLWSIFLQSGNNSHIKFFTTYIIK
jgi:hypothetical protein